ncbi:hypothetical protein DPSP01_000360 [Paraphaeosphaeria sporulosa]
MVHIAPVIDTNAMPTSSAISARAPSLGLNYWTFQRNCNPSSGAQNQAGYLTLGTDSCHYFPGVGEAQIRQASAFKITSASGMGAGCYIDLYPQTGCGGTRMGRIGPIGDMGAGSCIVPADGSTGQAKAALSVVLRC